MLKQTKHLAVIIPILIVLIISGVILIKVINTKEIIEIWRLLFAIFGFLLTCFLAFVFIRKIINVA